MKVKNEVRLSFSHQLSRLRHREQQILEKLDTVASVKDGILSQQQDQMHQALGMYMHYKFYPSIFCHMFVICLNVRCSLSVVISMFYLWGACTQGLEWLQTAFEDVKTNRLTSIVTVEQRISDILNKYYFWNLFWPAYVENETILRS